MPWGHATISRFDLPPSAEAETPKHQYRLTFSPDAAAGQEILSRFVASCIVFALRPEGLEEAVTSLWDIFDFHRNQPSSLAIESGQFLMTGTVVGQGERTPFAFQPEDQE